MNRVKPNPKILLVSLDAKFIHSNLALRYLESYYLEHCQRALPVDFTRLEFTINQQISRIVAQLYEQKADLIGFSCYIWNIEMIQKIIRNFKKVAPETMIVLGGPEVSFDSADCMQEYPEIDYIICGEGESAFAALIRHVFDDRCQADQLPDNITYRDRQANVIVPAISQGRIKELDMIPSPYQRNFDRDVFSHRIIYYETSRGCPYSCQYCLSSTDQGVRFFSLERVKQDLLLFMEAGVKQVKFVDRTFNCAPQYAKQIFQWIIENHQGKTNFHFEIAADILTDDIIEYLKQAPYGLFQLEIGVQSTYGQTLEAIQRKTNWERLKKAVLAIKQGGNIHQHLDLIVGLPHEDYQQFSQSFDDVYQLGPEKLQMGFLKLLKGSGLRREQEQYQYLYTEEAPYEILQSKDLHYCEVVRLKEIEDILDHYYNSHQFEKTLLYLMKSTKLRPFEFYEQIAIYCKSNGFFERSHSQTALYEYLYGFAQTVCSNKSQIDIVKEVMKFDFFRLGPHGKLPGFLNLVQEESFKQRRQQLMSDETFADTYYPRYKQMNMRLLSQYVRLEPFLYDIENPDQQEQVCYLFVYHDDPLQFQRADWYKI